MLLAGEAGVGKTVLLRTFCTDLDGDSTYWGRCERLFSPRALGLFVDIAEQVGGDVERLVAEGGHPHEYVRALIRGLPADRVSVVVIEDLNWADETTLDVLKLLTRRVESCRC
ncbi:HTH-type transcriptional regulator malT [Rhodococcus wratislaviensis IFP 2016]|uniref:HTH-type transcriptional regulator malT n=1 Tax=Rhodococcus opacus M213 TaxID=1129896 RepID=K8XP26_RHOOP|nr:HTH-type transcriptional regulator malT [Rhodococcus opacus M213]ELB93528.1 HTH-type transcriptional regulator malT [Rhodococcus wratislaviensis IFP 2016]